MIDTKIKLSVLHDDDGTFADRSEEAVDFSRDTFSIALDQDDDYLYIGYSKPIGTAYCEITTANTNASEFTAEYWNGSEWVAVREFLDSTRGFTQSGWLSWIKEDTSTWQTNEVDTVEKYWVRLRASVTHSATTVSGINLVFADDYDLQTEFPSACATGFLPTGETSHIKAHVAARNQIIQELRNRGYKKVNSEGQVINLTIWDLHDTEEVKQAAIWLALSKIFFNYSDDENDTWMSKSKAYEARYNKTLDTLYVSTDADDDGNLDNAERAPSRVIRMQR